MKKILSISVLLLIASTTTFGQTLISTSRSNIKRPIKTTTPDSTVKKQQVKKQEVKKDGEDGVNRTRPGNHRPGKN